MIWGYGGEMKSSGDSSSNSDKAGVDPAAVAVVDSNAHQLRPATRTCGCAAASRERSDGATRPLRATPKATCHRET